MDGFDAAETVGEGCRERGGQGQGDKEEPLVGRLTNADVAHLGGPILEEVTLLLRASEELDQHRPGDVEALGHHHVHLGVELHAPLKERAQAPAHSTGGDQKDGHENEGDQRDRPAQDEHHHQDDHHEHHVAHDVGEEVREGLLGTDHVVVQSTDEGAGLGAREEGDRHLLNVLEDGRAQVVDQTLADDRRDPPLEHLQTRVTDREHAGEHRETHDEMKALVVDAHVDDLAQQQRRDRGDDGVHDHDAQKEDESATVPAREPKNTRQRSLLDAVLENLPITRERAQTPSRASASASHAHPFPFALGSVGSVVRSTIASS